jgi:hypothetical protein
MHDATPLPVPSLVPPAVFEPIEPIPVASDGFPVERVLRDL